MGKRSTAAQPSPAQPSESDPAQPSLAPASAQPPALWKRGGWSVILIQIGAWR